VVLGATLTVLRATLTDFLGTRCLPENEKFSISRYGALLRVAEIGTIFHGGGFGYADFWRGAGLLCGGGHAGR